MWTTVYIALGKAKTHSIERLAKDEGFYLKTQYYGKEGNDEMFELITLESEAEEFYNLLMEKNII